MHRRTWKRWQRTNHARQGPHKRRRTHSGAWDWEVVDAPFRALNLKVRSYAAEQIMFNRGGANARTTPSVAPELKPQHSLEKRTATRPGPSATRLDLHLALHLKRRVNAEGEIDFVGQSWHIAPTKRSSITLIHQPRRQFRALTRPPTPPLKNWPKIPGKHSR
jgi:hypothetical protein